MCNIIAEFSNKKRIILILCLIILLLLFIVIGVTYANSTSNFQFDIECKNSNGTENIHAGDDLICSVFGNVKSSNISGLDTTIALDGNLTLNNESIKINDEFNNNEDLLYSIDNNDNSVIILEANNFANVETEKTKLIEFKVRASKDIASTGIIKLTNTVIVSNDIEMNMNDYSKEINISKMPTAAYLTSLTVDNEDIFNFESNTFTYESKIINKDTINIKAVASENARIKEPLGDIKLNYGKNDFSITVISSTDVETVYKFSIYRPYSSTLLDTFKVVLNDKTIDLDKSLDSQKITVNSDKIEIIATGLDGSKVTGTGIKELSIGSNYYEILVTSEDETNTKTYTLNIYRQNNDTSIKELYVNDNKLTIEDNNTYNIDINNLNVNTNIVLSDKNATYKLYKINGEYKEEITPNNIEITDGSDNKFEIVVLAENGENKETYTLNIHELNSDSYLTSLTIDNIAFAFDMKTFNYELNTNLEEITITALSSSTKSTVEGTGKKTLQDGKNTFTIIVTAEDKTTQIYTLNINKITMEEKIIFNNLTVNEEKKYIYNIEVGTKPEEIINNIETTGKVSIINDIVATGNKVKIEFDNYSVEYIIIVKGDVNGDGKVTLSDITTSLKGYKHKIYFADYMFVAVDFNNDGEFKLSDIVNHLKYYKKHK